MQGYRKNLIRWYADRTGVINANDVLRFTFPKEILDLDSLMHYFEFTSTAAATGTSSVRQGTFFPRNSASIIDTITVFINGQVFENITSYNHLFNLIYDNIAGHNFYQSGVRAIECADPSIRYTITNAGVITGTVQGATSTATTDATACDNARPLQITNWIGFLGTCNRIVDFTDVEVVVEIRYAPANIMFLGAAVASPSSLTPSYTINNYYMTAQKITFDDDDYYRALNSLKSSGNYILTFKTYTYENFSDIIHFLDNESTIKVIKDYLMDNFREKKVSLNLDWLEDFDDLGDRIKIDDINDKLYFKLLILFYETEK